MTTNKIIRVFPRRTSMTPTDEFVRINEPPGLFDEADEVHISVTFTWDLPVAKKLLGLWTGRGKIEMGGPALGDGGDGFTPGLYVKEGIVATSRGCIKNCWFCYVPKRCEGIKELEIKDGYNIIDDNLLACSERHIRDVFVMLRNQKKKPVFSGGLDPERMKQWIADFLIENKARFYFAYDTPDDLEPLRETRKLFPKDNTHDWWCYVLIGYKGDTFSAAEKRIKEIMNIGYWPFAMLYRDDTGIYDKQWRRFQRAWTRPEIIFSK